MCLRCAIGGPPYWRRRRPSALAPRCTGEPGFARRPAENSRHTSVGMRGAAGPSCSGPLSAVNCAPSVPRTGRARGAPRRPVPHSAIRAGAARRDYCARTASPPAGLDGPPARRSDHVRATARCLSNWPPGSRHAARVLPFRPARLEAQRQMPHPAAAAGGGALGGCGRARFEARPTAAQTI